MPPTNGRAPPGGNGAPSENHCKSETQHPQHNPDTRSLQGLARIETKDDGTYVVDPHGKLAALVPVRDRYGELVDLVAWFPDNPSAWWLRYGDECPVLGSRALGYGRVVWRAGCSPRHTRSMAKGVLFRRRETRPSRLCPPLGC